MERMLNNAYGGNQRVVLSSIWFKKWTNTGPLYLHPTDVLSFHPLKDISEFLNEKGMGQWKNA